MRTPSLPPGGCVWSLPAPQLCTSEALFVGRLGTLPGRADLDWRALVVLLANSLSFSGDPIVRDSFFPRSPTGVLSLLV